MSRVFTTNDTYYPGYEDPIRRLSYQLDDPVTLEAGEYWFSHDAQVTPEPAGMLLLFTGLVGVAGQPPGPVGSAPNRRDAT